MAESEKQSIKEQLAEITARIEDGIKDLFQSDKYAQYLKTMSRFHNYSFNNTMLIFMQKPNATAVAGFKAWQRVKRAYGLLLRPLTKRKSPSLS